MFKLSRDGWRSVFQFLKPDDLYSCSLVCKVMYRAIHVPEIQKKISYPMVQPYKLTYDQRILIKQMEKDKEQKYKRVIGPVGSGKTIVSLCYAIRNYLILNGKIYIILPPNLIRMWIKTLKEKFGLEACILHSTCKKYSAKTSWNQKPKEKIIITSAPLAWNIHSKDLKWFSNPKEKHILIIDESHHSYYADRDNFENIIELTATENSDIIDDKWKKYKLSNTIINKKIRKAINVFYKLPIGKQVVDYYENGYQDQIQFNCRQQCYILKSENTKLKTLISHPYLANIGVLQTRIVRKKYSIDGYFGSPVVNSLEKILQNMEKAPKIHYTYYIVQHCFKKGEKVILFDKNIKYLPLLHLYFQKKNMTSYIFSSFYSGNRRNRMLQQFKDRKVPCILLSSYNIMAEGHNITEANNIIFYSIPSKYKDYSQCIGRCNRYPQNKNVYAYHLHSSIIETQMYQRFESYLDSRNYSKPKYVNKINTPSSIHNDDKIIIKLKNKIIMMSDLYKYGIF